MSGVNAMDLVTVWHRVAPEDVAPLRVALAILIEQGDALEAMAVGVEDVDGGVLLTFPVEPDRWDSKLKACGGNEAEAQAELGRIAELGILYAAGKLSPQQAARFNRPN